MLDNGEAQSGAANLLGVAFIHPVKALKNPALMLRRDADTGVGHAQDGIFPLKAHGELYAAALPVVLDGIVAEIIDHAADKLGNAPYKGRLAADLYRDLCRLRLIFQAPCRRFCKGIQVQLLPLHLLRALIQTGKADDILH